MDAEGDVLYGIDGIIGSVHDDTLTGSAPGASNATTFAAYRHSPEAVTVLLHDGTALGGDADGDTFEAVHSLLGSRHDDTLGSDEHPNVLAGAYRHDRLVGKAGDDVLHGDHLTGRGYTGGDDRIDLAAFDGVDALTEADFIF